MKTPRNAGRNVQPNQSSSAQQVRRQRTLTSFACESLEGRKLMTGFAGASAAMMGHGPADMGDMNGGGTARGDWHQFDGATTSQSQGQTSQDSSSQDDSTSGSDATGHGMRSFRSMDDAGGDDSFAMDRQGGMGGDRMDLGGRGDRAGRSFEGDSLGGFPGDMQGGGGQADGPMANRVDSGDHSGDSAADTQLNTDLTKLQTDSQAIHDKSQVTPALLASVRKDLEAIDKAKTGDADATALKTLQTDEQTIFSSKTDPTDAQLTQLQADHDAVLKSQGVSQTLIDQLATDRLAVKTASNFTDADKATLTSDRAAIDTDRAASSTNSTSGDSSTTPDSSTQTSTSPTLATTSTATPAVAAIPAVAATPDVAASSTPDQAAPAGTSTPDQPSTAAMAPDQATPPVAPATPDQVAPQAAAPVAATPSAPMASTDPTMTQMTSTAAPTTMTPFAGMGRHGHGGVERALAGQHGGSGHQQANHSARFAGLVRHNSRG